MLLAQAIYRRIADEYGANGKVYLGTENRAEPALLDSASPFLLGGSTIEASDRSSIFNQSYSLIFEFTSSGPQMPNSCIPVKIMILNIPDYQWFRKNGTCKRTQA